MDGILRAAVAATNAAFMGAAVDVVVQQWIGHKNEYGAPDYAVAFTRKALVQEGTDQLRLTTGEVITTLASIDFLEEIPANGAPGRHEPVDPRDLITLPGGQSGPIVKNPGGTQDPLTGKPYVSKFWLSGGNSSGMR